MLSKIEVDNLKSYLTLLDPQQVNPSIISDIQEVIDNHQSMQIYPVCVPSYHRGKRTKFLEEAIKDGFINQVTVYCYDREADDYKDCSNKVLVPWSFREMPGFTIAYKRQFIIDDQIKKGASHIFMIDDDRYHNKLLYPNKTSNKRFSISQNTLFHIWTHLINKYKLDYSGQLYVISCAYYDLKKYGLVKPFTSVFSSVHLNLDYFKRGVKYDAFSGWEDLDVHLHILTQGGKIGAIPIEYTDGGHYSSVLDYHANSKTAIRNTIRSVKKWGNQLVVPGATSDIQLLVNWKLLKKIPANERFKCIEPVKFNFNMYRCVAYTWNNILSNKSKREFYSIAFKPTCPPFKEFKKMVDERMRYEEENPPLDFLKRNLNAEKLNRLGIRNGKTFPKGILKIREKLFPKDLNNA